MFLYVYVDILGFHKPGTIPDILIGRVWEFDITQEWALGALALMTVPILMVFLSMQGRKEWPCSQQHYGDERIRAHSPASRGRFPVAHEHAEPSLSPCSSHGEDTAQLSESGRQGLQLIGVEVYVRPHRGEGDRHHGRSH